MKKLDYVYESKAEYPETLNRFLTYLSDRESAENTIIKYEGNIKEFLKVISINKEWIKQTDLKKVEINKITNEMIDSITLEDIEDYMKFCLNKKTSRSNKNTSTTRNNKISSLDTFYKFLMKSKIVKGNLIDGIERPKLRQKQREPLTREEAQLLIETIKNSGDDFIAVRDYTIFTLYLNTGMRLNELVQLDIQDIKLKKQTLKTVTKGEETRIIDLSDMCVENIASYLKYRSQFMKEHKNIIDKEDMDALFFSRKGNRLSDDAIQKTLKKYAEMAGLDPEKVHPHILRHTSATIMVENGVPLNVIQKQLGHKNIQTTTIYAKVNSKETRKAVNSINIG